MECPGTIAQTADDERITEIVAAARDGEHCQCVTPASASTLVITKVLRLVVCPSWGRTTAQL